MIVVIFQLRKNLSNDAYFKEDGNEKVSKISYYIFIFNYPNEMYNFIIRVKVSNRHGRKFLNHLRIAARQ